MTQFPSLSNLVSWLFYLAWYSILYRAGLAPWSKVAEQQTNLSNWFGQLKQWALDQISAARTAVTTWAQSWISYLDAWRSYLAGKVADAWTWINDTAAAVVTWVNLYKTKLAYYVDTVSAWLNWFFANPLYAIGYYLGVSWVWVRGFFLNQYATLRAILGAAWDWLANFYANPWAIIKGYLGLAWDWLQWFWSNPLGALNYYLGGAWAFVQYLFGNQYKWISDVLGDPWRFLLGLFGTNPEALKRFIRDAMIYWYNIWSLYHDSLSAFLENPARFTLAAIREVFLDWLTQLIADNW